MLQQFTWQQFLVAAMVLSLIWYLGVILIYFRSQVIGFFGNAGIGTSAESLPHRWEKGVEILENQAIAEDELMGKSKLPDGMESVSMGSFGFVQTEDGRQAQVGLIPDVLQELKEVFSVIAEEDGSKKDFFNLMEMVRQKFPNIGSNPSIPQINQFIAQHAPFHLSAEELENLWD